MRRLLIVGIMAWVPAACSSPQTASYNMTWGYENDGTCRSMRHVVLRFVDYPAYVYGFCSDELASYLDTLAAQTVPVDFEIYAPEAQLGGGSPIRVGTLEDWEFEFAHMGSRQDSVTASAPPHPWERLRSGRTK